MTVAFFCPSAPSRSSDLPARYSPIRAFPARRPTLRRCIAMGRSRPGIGAPCAVRVGLVGRGSESWAVRPISACR